MPKQIWKTILFLFLLCGLLLGLSPQTLQAQTNEPPLRIVGVDTTQFPTIQLTLAGTTWPADRATAPLQILVNDEAQTIADDQLLQQPIGFMVAIDPNELLQNGQAGQTRYVEMTGALLDLIENEILVRNQDWLAAYLLLPGQVQTIQEWTQEPNLVFNSIVQQQPPDLQGAPLTAETLVAALQRLQESPVAATLHKSLLLISAGAEGLEIAPTVAAAQAAAVQIHAVELISTTVSAGNASTLAQLAQQTGGHYIALDSPAALQPLWQRIAAEHNSRVVTFQSTVAQPQTLAVQLQLPGGVMLSDQVGAEAFTTLPAAVTDPAHPVQAEAAQAETQSTIAYSLPATAGEQAPADQPAAEAPIAAVELPSSAAPAAQSEPSVVTVPGSNIALPRGLLQFGLVVLLGLIAYFVYAEMRDRRKKRHPTGKPPVVADPLFNLEENSQPVDTQFRLQGQDGKSVRPPMPTSPPPARVAPPAPRPAARPSASLFQEDEGDLAEPTVRPARMEDDEATYRAQTIEQPIIAYLIRNTSDPNLPKELPVYGLNPAPGEVRQIHIGRHSKHNTVVINDKSISREHAVIIQRQGRLYLRDNASTSGTFLNWKRLNPGEELLLRHNDLISFGQIVYEFRLHGEDEVTIAGA